MPLILTSCQRSGDAGRMTFLIDAATLAIRDDMALDPCLMMLACSDATTPATIIVVCIHARLSHNHAPTALS